MAKSVLYICITIDISLNGINDTIISDATFNDVITIPRLFPFSAVYNEVKPLFIVRIKS